MTIYSPLPPLVFKTLLIKEVFLELRRGEWVLLLKESQRKGGEDGGGTVDIVTCVLGVKSLVLVLTLPWLK